MADITHRLFAKEEVPDQYHGQIAELLGAYDRDIGGTDLGPNGIWDIAIDKILLLHDADDKVVGFLAGSRGAVDLAFKEEKTMCISAAYLVPEYRNSSGKHTGVLKDALEALVDAVEAEGFDGIRIFPSPMFYDMLVTDVGKDHVLKPLYDVTKARQESGKGSVIGGDDPLSLRYVFDFDDYAAKVRAAGKAEGQ